MPARHILITLPAEESWAIYELELAKAERGEFMNFKVSRFPKDAASGATKVYIQHQKKLIGWMYLKGMAQQAFTCTTTGREWSGKFLIRGGTFFYVYNGKHGVQLDMPKGFQGWHYFDPPAALIDSIMKYH